MQVYAKCRYCGKRVHVRVLSKDYNNNPDMLDKCSCSSCHPEENGLDKNGVHEIIYEDPFYEKNTDKIILDKVKEKMYSMAGTFFLISETLVDESKKHISSEEAIGKIRELMRMNDIPCSCFAVDKMLEEIRDTL